ncbi:MULTISPECIES: hypothetical protein [Bacteroides]|uniref:hypothetical protein n=1 Tax=Bacteroides TaxID=816 RepID=UPI00095AC8B0|nr:MULTISPECIES: hypothetical protein [Bacteroides]OKZ01191.1 MAG: hypothetical protein BHV73_04245 [Bacteroides sp. 44_46]
MRLKFILNGSGKTLNGSRLMAFDDRSVSDGSFLTEEQGAFHRGTARSSPRKKEPLILRVQK